MTSLDDLYSQATNQNSQPSLDSLFSQASRVPADANLAKQADTQFRAQHPFLATLQDTTNQAIVNPIAQAWNPIARTINGINAIPIPGIGPYQGPQAPTIQTPDMSNAPLASKVVGDVGSAVGNVASALPFSFTPAGPVGGFGISQGLQAQGQGQPFLPSAISGAVSAIPYMIGGAIGSKVASPILNKFAADSIGKYAPNIGTALGMSAAGALTAPQGQKLESGLTGGLFGAVSPMGAPKDMTQSQYDNLTSQLGDIYRQVLNPSKGIIQKIEIKGGKDIDDSMKLAAQMGLIIKKDPLENKLDTRDARDQIEETVQPLHQQLNQILSSNPQSFDLNELRDQAIQNLKGNPNFKVAADYQKGVDSVNNYIDAEIKFNNGNPIVDGVKLNNIKEGMWATSYDNGAPNNYYAARQLGNTFKDAIERAYSGDADIAGLNQERGKYLQLDNILAQTHGNVIQGGKLGYHFARILGSIGGLGMSQAPGVSELPGMREFGWAAGMKLGDLYNRISNDPERITTGLASRIKNINITNQEEQNNFISPKQTPATPQIPDEGDRMENEGGPSLPIKQSDITPEIKEQAKQATNQWWLGQFNPLNKDILKAAVPATALGLFGNNESQASTIGQKNNNPINLKGFQSWDGMTGKDQFGHAQFENLDMGIRAGLKNLENHFNANPDQTLNDYLNTFAQKNGDKEAEFIASKLGITTDTPLSKIDPDKMIIPLAQFESKINLTPKQVKAVRNKYL